MTRRTSRSDGRVRLVASPGRDAAPPEDIAVTLELQPVGDSAKRRSRCGWPDRSPRRTEPCSSGASKPKRFPPAMRMRPKADSVEPDGLPPT